MSIFASATNPLAFDPSGFVAQLRALDVPVPADLEEIIAVAAAAGRVAPDRTVFDTLVADAAAGRLSADEVHDRVLEAAQSLLLTSGSPHPIGRVREALADPLRRRALAAIAANAADIDQALAAPLAQAVDHLEHAAQVLGDSAPDPGRTPQGGPVAQEAAQRWQQGHAMLDSIRRIRDTLAQNCRYGGYPMTATRWCELTTPADHDRFMSTTQNLSQLWRAVPAGYQLTIIPPERAAELEAAIAKERAQQERRRNQTSVKRHNKRVERELAAWRAVGVEIGDHRA